MTTHPQLMQGLRTHEALTLWPHTFSWCGADLGIEKNISFTFTSDKVIPGLFINYESHVDVWGTEGIATSFLTLAIDGVKWSDLRP